MSVARRRYEVSRLEAFSDAAFAFALTLLVVSLDVPRFALMAPAHLLYARRVDTRRAALFACAAGPSRLPAETS